MNSLCIEPETRLVVADASKLLPTVAEWGQLAIANTTVTLTGHRLQWLLSFSDILSKRQDKSLNI